MSFQFLRSVAPALDKLPGPPRWPLPIGNLPELISARKKNVLGFFLKQMEWRKEYGPVYRMIAGNRPLVVVTEPSLVKEIVRNDPANYTKGFSYEHLGPWFGSSILMSEGEEWRRKRRHMTPAFAAKALKTFVPKYIETADEVIDMWFGTDRCGGEQTVSMGDDMTKATLQVIGRCAFDFDMRALQPERTRFAEEVERVLNVLTRREENPLAMMASVTSYMRYFRDGRQYASSIDYMKRFAGEVVKEREGLQEREQLDVHAYRDLLSIILEDVYDPASGSQAHMELVEEVLLFLFAGHETTSTLLSWAIYFISARPDVHQRVMAEMKEHLPSDPKAVPTYEELNKLEYMTCVLKECLRLYSPAPGFIREPITDVELGGHLIPAKVPLFINSYIIHRDERFWSDPETFDPDRFLPEQSKGRPPMAWLPFAVGARNCVGMQFGMLEARAILSRLLLNVNIKPLSKPEPTVQMLMKPTPYSCKVSLR